MAVQRQTQAQYRDAIQTLRQSPEQGFEKLEQLGAVREVPYAQAITDVKRKAQSRLVSILLDDNPHNSTAAIETMRTHEKIIEARKLLK